MLPRPSVLDKTPSQHMQDADRLTRQAARRGEKYTPVPPKIPPRHARVLFYEGLWRIEEMKPANLCADVPLEPCGGLDLRKVCAIWGLESCQPIDPLRWTIFEPGKPDWLSNVAVQVLSDENGCIKVIEPAVSDSTQYQRLVRQSVFDIFVGLMTIVTIIPLAIQCRMCELAENHTPLMRMYRNSWRERKQLKRRVGSWASVVKNVQIDWAAAARLLFMIVSLVMVIAVLTGKVELAIRQRARNWARTGSISL